MDVSGLVRGRARGVLTSMSIRALNVVWFKRDLGTVDHRALADAAARRRVWPLFIVEPNLLQETHPAPIVDPIEAAKQARAKIRGDREGRAFRQEADRIQAKNGRRKSGLPMTGRRGNNSPSRLDLDF
jgi:hypothetical protein